MKESEKQYFEDIFEDITNKVTQAVKEQVVITVNGKIDGIKEHLKNQDLHLDRIDKKLDELRPVSQFIIVTKLARKFLIWAAPLTGIGALIKWIIK